MNIRTTLTGLLLLSSLILFTGCAQKTTSGAATTTTEINKQVMSHEGEPILLGLVDRTGFQKAPFSGWFNPTYQEYQVRTADLQGVAENLKDVNIEVFMGTWCGDSQLEVPQFYKILDHLKFPEKRLKVYAVDNHPDRRKTTPGGEATAKKIEFVPTFIFIRGGKEIGRITEYPQKSLEKDMAEYVK